MFLPIYCFVVFREEGWQTVKSVNVLVLKPCTQGYPWTAQQERTKEKGV
jgi:hypothetical protein